ncbi:ABC-2 type transporter-domain-containing protein [Thelonectria olida]|uniref:ABC-2 type transporter-domain-containing protein n=1 Tax=Thelonectria olida TaxID=1576542 RepID=A0A9P8VWU6_9HYPO|nr:ABC-2 type transporter-domain-containing protein [Thelonectria olida]
MTADSVPTNRGSSASSGVTEEEDKVYAGFEPIMSSRLAHKRSPSDLDDAHLRHHRRDTEIVMEEADRAELTRLATVLSRRQSTVAPGGVSRVSTTTMVHEDDPAIDPASSHFDVKKWLHRTLRLHREEGIGSRQIGVVFKNVSVFGSGDALQIQQTVGSLLSAPLHVGELFSFRKKTPKKILNQFDGLIRSGELLLVLGRPGSGCSTLLKTISGDANGLEFGSETDVHYNGIPQKQMKKEFKGEAIYNQEVDKHFPHLTVGQTLEFAASARTPSTRINNLSRKEWCKYSTQIVMATFGLSHTYNTKVGNDFVRGVSGGERKRVSIAEMVLAGSPITAWDNSTRGLDSATAFAFVRALRIASDLADSVSAVAIYQASQSIYDLFDKVTLLYEGRQVYFGPVADAKAYFERQGWYCPQRQTTGDFLTAVTNPSERKARKGMENKVPRTAEDFERYWRESPEYALLQTEIAEYEAQYLGEGQDQDQQINNLREHKSLQQVKRTRSGSPYLISVPMQIKLNTVRAYQRVWQDISATMMSCMTQLVLALIIGSVFYDTPDATAGFYAKGSVLFMAILLNALTAIAEINSLYSQRPIIEKHASYAFYHPATEAAAGIVADIPIKFVTAVMFNVVLYFMAGLRREAGPFFLYFLVTYVITFVMSAVFRTMAALTKTISQAMALAGVLILALVVYTGFVITVPSMPDWFGWIRWVNPVFYGFEILIANEFHGKRFPCSDVVPSYTPQVGDSWICSIAGAIAGEHDVSGDRFIETTYRYSYSHVWRNFGIVVAFLVFFMTIYFVATELNSSMSSTAEALVFQSGHVPAHLRQDSSATPTNEESGPSETTRHLQQDNVSANTVETGTDIFSWRDVVYDIQIKSEERRLLDNVAGWVKPGSLTALMGVSGAGKTTLLDVLAQRVSVGVVTGDMFVNGAPLGASFQRTTGYVQQQDLHLETATVRESLRFSADLRQPRSVSQKEKYEYVEKVISMLNMEDYADAVVGSPGEGLNVEQRKLLTIAVELAARPKFLLFLDEPTSGLDSQSSWAICSFLRKLADAGQAVLCTIHQPSATLFQEFDRLLFLARGGKTVYFGDIGQDSRTLLDYFESHGARHCADGENPAEYMLETVNGDNDWHSVWKASDEFQGVQAELDRLHSNKGQTATEEVQADASLEFAAPFSSQLWAVTYRVFQQYWRMPTYIASKLLLGVACGLFIGFTFYDADGSQAGMQNVIFSVFMVTTIFSTLVQQASTPVQPLFITQRSLYEVRERPSKAYSWKAFMLANIAVEIPYQVLTGILLFACFYYPVVGIQSSERQGLVLLFTIQLFIYASSFAHMTIAALPDAQTASGIVTLITLLATTFCGVMQTPDALPGFWIFMYRVSPFTYWIGGIAATELHGRTVECSTSETSVFNPPIGQTCGEYLESYLQTAPGQLQNPNDTSSCRYCSLSNADQYMVRSSIFWSERWRNYGIMWAYIAFNIFVAVLTYYIFRVPKGGSDQFITFLDGAAPMVQGT